MAHDHHTPTLADHETQPIGERATKWSLMLFGVGGLSLIGGLIAALVLGKLDSDIGWGWGWERFGFSYLAGFAFALSIALGFLLLVLVTHLFRAGWVIVIRRVIECFAASMPALAVLFIPVLLYVFMGNGSPYPWTGTYEDAHGGGNHGATEHHDEATGEHAGVAIMLVANDEHGAVQDDHGHADTSASADHGDGHDTHGAASTGDVNLTYGEYGDAAKAIEHDIPHFVDQKGAFLNEGMFSLLWILFFAIWSILGIWYYKVSVAQDATKDPTLTNKREAAAPVSTLLFALTLTFAAFTLLMSMDPTWYSTMYGVYYFAGAMTGAIAVLILVLTFLRKAGVLTSVTVEHMHDLGKLQFTFVVFWAYIAYSQYMLIWYGSIPAEQPWMVIRGMSTAHPNAFSGFAVFMLVGHFLLPFVFLLSRHVKRNPVTLAIGATWMLLMQACDIYWLVLPEFNRSAGLTSLPIPLPEILCMIGATAVLLGAAAHVFAKAAPVPHGDPRLTDSLNFRNF